MSAEVSTRQSAEKVLDEDEWTECLEAIVQRDYFPNVPKLQNKLEWIEAVRSRDPDLLRQAQLNIAQRRAGIRTPMGATPAHFATPGLTSFRAPASMLRTPGGAQTPGPGNTDGLIGQQLPQPEPSMAALAVEGMSLDRFMAKHTSEDNASFAQIMVESNKRRRLNKPWLFEQKDKGQLLLEDVKDRPLDGYGTTGQPEGRLLEWPYTSKNALYYGRDAVALSDAERSQQVQGPPKAINMGGTRFTPAAALRTETPSSTDDSPSISIIGSDAPGQDYSILATPSFTPGVEESPFITWGELQGTPLRLDLEDDIEVDPAAASGPQFEIRERSGKDALAQNLGRRAATKLRERTATARRKAPLPVPGSMPPPGTTPGRRGRPGTLTPARPQMSQAGKKLAQTLHGKASSDSQLRASYSGTPSKRPSGGTPLLSGLGQPVPARTPLHKVLPPKFQSSGAAAGAPAAGQSTEPKQQAVAQRQQAEKTPQSGSRAGAGLTDDLLNILRDEAVQKHVGAIRDKAVQHHVGAIREKALKELAVDKQS